MSATDISDPEMSPSPDKAQGNGVYRKNKTLACHLSSNQNTTEQIHQPENSHPNTSDRGNIDSIGKSKMIQQTPVPEAEHTQNTHFWSQGSSSLTIILTLTARGAGRECSLGSGLQGKTSSATSKVQKQRSERLGFSRMLLGDTFELPTHGLRSGIEG